MQTSLAHIQLRKQNLWSQTNYFKTIIKGQILLDIIQYLENRDCYENITSFIDILFDTFRLDCDISKLNFCLK